MSVFVGLGGSRMDGPLSGAGIQVVSSQ